jgi:hypothetical protein
MKCNTGNALCTVTAKAGKLPNYVTPAKAGAH